MTDTQTPSEWKYIILVALGALSYSTVLIFTRQTEGLGSMSITFFRTFFAFLCFALLLLRFREPLRIREYRGSIPLLLALGVTVALTAALYVYAIQHTTAANAALLVNLAPVYIAFLAPWLLNERRPRHTFISLALVMVGVVLITDITRIKFNLGALDGIFAGVISGLTYSLSFVISRRLRGRASGFTQTLWGTGVASILLLPFAVRLQPQVINANLPVLVPLGILSLGLPAFLYYVALQKVKTQVVSVVALLEPVSGVFIGLLLYKEIPGLLGVIGILLILVGIYLISNDRQSTVKQSPVPTRPPVQTKNNR